MEKKYFADDRPITIPDRVKEMSEEELNAEIEKLEVEARKQRENIRQKRELVIA